MKRRRIRTGAILCMLCGLACAFLSVRGHASTNYPAWWSALGVLDTNRTVNDYAPALAGQLKWMATKAYDELQTNLPGGAGSGVAGRVAAFAASNNYVPVNLGQLKYVSEPFYARLIAAGYTNAYPWTTNSTADDVDYAPAVLGQLKNVFSFDVTFNSDQDGLPDWWEMHWFGSITNQEGSGHADADGLSNLEEYQRQTNPANADSDGDGLNDGDEVNIYGSDPLDSDSDNDGLGDGAEVAAKTDPMSSDTNMPAVTLISPPQSEVRIWIP